jgi:hypothetical protein
MNIRKLRWRFYKKTGGPRGWGNRCKEYCAGCILCELYRIYDNTGRFPTGEEARIAANTSAKHEFTYEIAKQVRVGEITFEEGQRRIKAEFP